MKPPSVLVIRKSGRFSALLRSECFDVVDLELVRTEPFAGASETGTAISQIDSYDGLFFTSPMAVQVFGERLREAPGYDGKIYALGERAKRALDALGFDVVYRETANTAADLIGSFNGSEFAGKRFLYVRGETSMRTIPEMLSGVADIDEVAVYRTVDVEPPANELSAARARLENGEFGAVCFFSPSGVERFRKLFSTGKASSVKAAVIGETTAASARAAGFDVRFISPAANAEAFARELAEYIKNIE